MSKNRHSPFDAVGPSTVEALQKNRFKAVFCETAQEALQQILAMIAPDATVGIGGSWTLMQLGVVEKLEERGNTVYCHHKQGLTPEKVLEIRRKQLTCDVFLAGANAITLDGRLVNTDATGNRVAAMIFGPKKIIIIAGTNKIVNNVAEAEERIKQIAAPLNSKRLKRPNPCVETGRCMDCQGPTRICNVTTIMNKCPAVSDIHIFIVGEELGF